MAVTGAVEGILPTLAAGCCRLLISRGGGGRGGFSSGGRGGGRGGRGGDRGGVFKRGGGRGGARGGRGGARGGARVMIEGHRHAGNFPSH